ncbi:hypothetical protein FCM35_KLT19806 [Carex littledalei]|uniref:Uncharacterized protein n=1 Tax=Carex littledalei TaxID=544730 RepID=A0A833RHM5_9POAL|nr:hypothetical protein FCM35_KLT19806 [Carex littledalei]
MVHTTEMANAGTKCQCFTGSLYSAATTVKISQKAATAPTSLNVRFTSSGVCPLYSFGGSCEVMYLMRH